MSTRYSWPLGPIAACLLVAGAAWAQSYGARLGVQRGGEVSFEPRGPGILFDALDPAVKRWYVPQELFNEYRWKQWEYSNYARQHYERYVNTALEGDYYYDVYGNLLTRGWLIYDWQRSQPGDLGNSIFKDNRYSGWFSQVLITSDQRGQYQYALTIGDRIRTSLTPLTFSKPAFNGIQADFVSDKYEATVLMSRVSQPELSGTRGVPESVTNSTDFFGTHLTAQVGDFVHLGTTYLNVHQTKTLIESFVGADRTGTLTTDQNRDPITTIEIILADDSPEDGEAGAALFSENITITARDFETGERFQVEGRNIGFAPLIQGGFQRRGFLSANGDEQISLVYDFSSPTYVGPDPTTIIAVEFELVVANDYRVLVQSDRQLGSGGEPHPLVIARADGNVRDTSNQQLLRFEYGLPTATEILGADIAVTGIAGFRGYAEFAINRRYRHYPNANLEDGHETSRSSARAWMANLSKIAFPWFAFGEAFGMDSDYTTDILLTDEDGEINYASESRRFEFVDDNDDQDRLPDWTRSNQLGTDPAVFPGWDENNDFINDFNQNDNEFRISRIPDYDEPFLRFRSDRPEFLFGIDLNNNQWIDRFENDEQADYPYKRDHEGYNAYVGAHVFPDARLTAGRTRQKLISGDGRNETNYGLFTFDRDFPNLGRVRVFERLKKTRDNIADDRIEATPFHRGPKPRIPDPLAAQDTWINTLWLGFQSQALLPALWIDNKLKFEILHQLLDAGTLATERRRENSGFFGVINKAEYTVEAAGLRLLPRIKSEYVRDRKSLVTADSREQYTLSLFLVGQLPLMSNTRIEAGLEQGMVWDLQTAEDALAAGALSGDFAETVVAVQSTTESDYLGYALLTQVGVQYQRRAEEIFDGKDAVSTGFSSFVTVYAGLGR